MPPIYITVHFSTGGIPSQLCKEDKSGMYSLRLFCDINKEKGEKEGKNPLLSYGIIGFPQPPENWNLIDN